MQWSGGPEDFTCFKNEPGGPGSPIVDEHRMVNQYGKYSTGLSGALPCSYVNQNDGGVWKPNDGDGGGLESNDGGGGGLESNDGDMRLDI